MSAFMADDAQVIEVAPAAPVEAVAPVATPAPEPVVETVAAPEAAPSLIENAEVTEPVAEVAPEPVVETPPEPAAPEAEAAPVEVQPPTYTDFTLPEGVVPATEQMQAFTGVIGKFGLTQEAAQELVDLHAAEIKRYADQTEQHQRDTFDKTREGWRSQVDQRFGNRRNTVVEDAKWLIGSLVPDEKQRSELYAALAYTGAGDHPAMIGLLSAAAGRLRERSAPLQGIPPKGQPTRPEDRRYAPRS